jgi:hypothetical protein
MTLDDLNRLAGLEAENAQLRRLLDDGRRHLASLRETVRKLHEESDKLRRRGDALADENARLLTGRSRGYAWPVIGVVGVAIAGRGLARLRRHAAVPRS